jgi:mersacidin/lichenicidin family type 2 lantibiotic
MKMEKIVHSWKDEDYRMSLSSDEQALLPDNPAGLIELSDAELGGMAGGMEDRSWGGCYSQRFICPESLFVPCSLFACPSLGWGACSWAGCPSWGSPICQ